jgi:glycosyltransferase involved in cell wall biosynthesis
MRPRVVLLRGESLNPYELQSYAPLLENYDLVAVGSRHGGYDLEGVAVPVVRLRAPGRGRVARRLLGDGTARLLGLDRVLAGCRIVHSAETFLPVSEQAAAARARHGFRLALTCWENIPFLHDEDERVAARKRRVREAADLFLPVTEAARQALLLEGVPAERIVVQPVGVDRTVFRPAEADPALRRAWAVPDGWTTLLYCGRLLREKGVLDLVRALAQVPRTVLVLAGAGPERPRLERAAAALGVADRLRFAGPVAYHDVPRLYASADVLCLPSVPTPYWQEQFGMVLVEALACGLPIVAADSGSIGEVLGDAAVLVPPYAPAALAEALAALRDDPERRRELAARGGQRAAERYDAARVAASVAGHYERLLDER